MARNNEYIKERNFYNQISDLELLKELLYRVKHKKIGVRYSINKKDEMVMISFKNDSDNDALFFYLDKGKMSGLITDFKTQMDKIHNGNYGE